MTDTTGAVSANASTAGGGLSAEALLKQAVAGAAKPVEPKVETDTGKVDTGKVGPVRSLRRKVFGIVDIRSAAVGGAVLSLGLAIGAGATALFVHRGGVEGQALAQIRAEVDTGRAETARLTAEVGKIAGAIVKSGERVADDAKATRSDLTQRMARMEQALITKITMVGEKQDVADREQIARIAALGSQIEKRAAIAPAPAPVAAPQAAAKPASHEPVQTGSIAETKSAAEAKLKAGAVANWALREVYDGVAVLEDRKRRLIEVSRGDMIPGIGRAEAIERRGRSWVVVTKDGLITAQDW